MSNTLAKHSDDKNLLCYCYSCPADGTLNCDKGFRLEFDSLCKQIVYFLITFNCLFPLDYKYIGYSC